MSATVHVAVSATTLTAEEVAACFRRGIPFTELAILVVPPGETFGRSMTNILDARDKGASFVWQIDSDCSVLTIFPSWTHLEVFNADDELVMDELPLFRCRVSEFLRLIGVLPEAA